MLQKVKNNQGWLIIIYRVPSTPSTSRVTVWKKVKELGAFFLQQSVYILPNLPTTKEAINSLKEQIQHLGGECKILEVASLGEEQEKEVIAGFNANREEEYTEVIKACNELSREIDEESKTEDFHFADLEENEKHLQRVRELFENVTRRDYFGSDFQANATRMLNECEEKFGAFSHEVYSREGIVSDEKKPSITLDIGTKHSQKRAYARQELVAKLREIINSLNRDTLEVGNKKISPLADHTVLEWDYEENKEENTLEIKIQWSKKGAS
jgi:CRISPR/Cas system-associated endoribonuclease Cas2